MLREPAVAHQFYPGDPAVLRHTLDQLVPVVAEKQPAIALIAPHAGYVYSGGVAGETFASVTIPSDIVLMGPNHHGYGAPISLMTHGGWRMPMGNVPINNTLAGLLLKRSRLIEEDTLAHRFEHSLEVEVPFLQHLQPSLTITPLVISHLSYSSCQEVGEAIAAAIEEYGRPVLIVASSDMSHYESRESASAKDSLAMERVLAMDPEGLYRTVMDRRITMCGIMPATIAMVAAIRLGAKQARLVRYTDSGEVSGDTRQVVGYAGMAIS
ncbi:MAG: AmmeMemoRadiSam system protein B [Thermodesulfobacteriota bacterium]